MTTKPRRFAHRCKCCGKLRAKMLSALPSDPHRCGYAYIPHGFTWEFPRDRYDYVCCSISGYGRCVVQLGGACLRQVKESKPERLWLVEGAIYGRTVYRHVHATSRRSAIAGMARQLGCKVRDLEIDSATPLGGE